MSILGPRGIMRTIPTSEEKVEKALKAIELFLSGSELSRKDLFGVYHTPDSKWVNRFLSRMASEGAIQSNGKGRGGRAYKLASSEILLRFKSLVEEKDLQTKEKGIGRSFTMTDDLRALLDGLLLGDGHYSKLIPGGLSCCYQMAQREDRLEWLESVKKKFDGAGIVSKIDWRPSKKSLIKATGKIVSGRPSHQLRAACYWSLKTERLRWYPEGKKIIPKDIDLSNPIVLAHWYMGDGGIGSKKDSIAIATCCFSEEDLVWARDQMIEKLKIVVSIGYMGRYPNLMMHARHAERFLSIIRPHVVSCFNYKVPVLWKPIQCVGCGNPIENRTGHATRCDNCCSTRESGERFQRAFANPSMYHVPEK